MSSTDPSDSTYSENSDSQSLVSENSEVNQEKQIQLTNQQLDDMWQQLQQMNQKQQAKDEFFNTQPKQQQENAIITKITKDLFNPLSQRQNLDKIQGNQVIDYSNKITKYAPKIITIHETRKFWQMYKNQMNKSQLEVLGQYVKSQNSYIRKQQFLTDIKKKQK